MDRGALTTLLTDLELFKWIERLGLNGTQLGFEDIEEAPLPEVTAVDAAPLLDAARKERKLDLLFCAPDSVFVAKDGQVAQTTLSDDMAALLCDPVIVKRTHNVKPLYAALLKDGKRPVGFEMDTMLAAYLLDPLASGYALTRIAQQYGGVHTAIAAPRSSSDTPCLRISVCRQKRKRKAAIPPMPRCWKNCARYIPLSTCFWNIARFPS